MIAHIRTTEFLYVMSLSVVLIEMTKNNSTNITKKLKQKRILVCQKKVIFDFIFLKV